MSHALAISLYCRTSFVEPTNWKQRGVQYTTVRWASLRAVHPERWLGPPSKRWRDHHRRVEWVTQVPSELKCSRASAVSTSCFLRF